MIRLNPHLVQRDTARAVDWYQQALGAREVVRYRGGDRIVYAEMTIGDSKLTMADESPASRNHSPESLGGTTVTINLEVDDAHAVGKRMLDHGATVVFPIEDQFYGDRQGRLQDPFGHQWVITQHLEQLTVEEIQRRIDNYRP